ncbi:Sensory Transduction Protein Kinase [Bifidobacterium leontopitheci]|uniref:Sensory Transduction Protein Kinase n=2 Tax=Bifidobacterium leontopitheci TaxID=2650774 RepID=A0A6I1GI57_9BIFI|nr:Sensory Transduction Protein Kinase [Bifidobacterium leontopitheci]
MAVTPMVQPGRKRSAYTIRLHRLRLPAEAIGIVACCIPFAIDCLQIRISQWQDVLFAVLYAVGLIGLSWRPLPACVLLCAVQLGELLLPLDIQGPDPIWGACLAVIGLAVSRPVGVAASTAVLMMCAVPLGYWMYGSAVDMLALSPMLAFAAAFTVGYVSRLRERMTEEHRRIEKARSELERQRRQLELVHVLHDSVAGSCAYSIMMCRKLRDGDHELDADTAFVISDIERTLTQTLHELRNTVISPMRSELDGDGAVDDMADRTSQSSSGRQDRAAVAGSDVTALSSLRWRQAERLATLGFDGTIQLRGPIAGCREIPLLQTILLEATNNIIAHGSAGPYAIVITAEPDGGFRMSASNQCGAAKPDDQRDHHGLTMLRALVETHHGVMRAGATDGEWILYVEIPAEKCETADDVRQ